MMQTNTFPRQSPFLVVSRTALQKVLPSEIELNIYACVCVSAWKLYYGHIWPKLLLSLLFLSPFQAALGLPTSFYGVNKIQFLIQHSAYDVPL